MKKKFTWVDLLLVFLAGAGLTLYLILFWLLSLECSCGQL